MSDRTMSLTVVLDKDYRVDDAESIINAIKMIKGVGTVGVNVADSGSYVAYSMARMDLEKTLWDALHEKSKKEG